ncbi:MAG: hypothetical protein KIS84_11770, partial [Dokdonella sp.]|nr:hypothetical protein [Dokdonella sp.]
MQVSSVAAGRQSLVRVNDRRALDRYGWYLQRDREAGAPQVIAGVAAAWGARGTRGRGRSDGWRHTLMHHAPNWLGTALAAPSRCRPAQVTSAAFRPAA